MRILVVDDQADVRAFLREALRFLGHEATLCGDAATALEKCRAEAFPLMLLDWVMPETDGLELCRRIRALPDGDQPVLLIFTGRDKPHDLQKVLAAGADDYMPKPMVVELLQIRLTIAEERARQRAARREAEEKLGRLEKAVETMQLGVTITDTEHRILYTNPAEAQMHGYTVEELVGQDVRIFAPRESWEESMSPAELAGIHAWKRESTNVRRDGTTFPVQITSDVVSDPTGRPAAIVTAGEDITERKRAEEALRISEERYALAARGANDGLWDWNLEKHQIYYSERWKSMLGFAEDEIGNRPEEWLDRIHPADRQRVESACEAHLDGTLAHFECSHRLLNHNGLYRWVISRGLAVRDEEGTAYRMVGSLTDITGRGVHDELTGLPNRSFFIFRLQNALERHRKKPEYLFGVLLFDLDRFKTVNTSLGHVVGDELLIAVGNRLEGSLRATDTLARLEGTVARVGGDEFIILLEDLRDASQAIRLTERLQEMFARPFLLDGHEIFASASIGIALGSTAYEKPEDLIRDADTALHRAKALGRGRFEIFDETMHARAVATIQIENGLRRAVEGNEFRLLYQPIVSLANGKLKGLETLLRWQHPERGLLRPAHFLPVAEESELIVAIDRWVLREACEEWAALEGELASETHLSLNVNVSSRQFSQDDLVEQVRELLERSRFRGVRLNLEITEGVIMENPDSGADVLAQLKRLGVRLCLDDFGTGYSSLSYLHRFPLDTLKIDQSFVAGMDETAGGPAIVRAIVDLAHHLDMDVVAEGIETPQQAAQLQEMGCDYGQGYYYSYPVTSEQIRARFTDAFPWDVPSSQEASDHAS
ncbi:MAG: EAL domain-containing protein [bacterium]|nr:EAL domain-containing protein [bacterium]